MGAEKYYPNEANLGKNCMWWNLGVMAVCGYPKAELAGRQSCEGMIDDVCLFLKDGRTPWSLSRAEIIEIKTRIPTPENNALLPPGEVY